MSLFAFLDFGAAWLCLFLGVFIWSTNRGSKLNRIVSGAWFVYAVPTFAAAFLVLATEEASRWLAFRVSYTGYSWVMNVLNPVGFVLYLRYSRPVALAVGVPLALATAYFTSGVWTGVGPVDHFAATPWGTVAVFHELGLADLPDFATNVAAFAVMAVASGLRCFRAPTPRVRSLARRLCAALWALAVVQGVLMGVLGTGIPDVTPALVLLLGVFYSFLLLRYRQFGGEAGNLESFWFESTHDGVFFLSDDGRVLRANGATKRITQQPPEALVGTDWASHFDDPDQLRALISAEDDNLFNLPWKKQDVALYLSLRWTRDALGHRMGAIAVVRKQAQLVETLEGYQLTPREQEIAVQLLQGASNQEIGDALFISVGTVKNHLVSVYKKTGAANRVELFRILLGVR